MTRSTVAPRLPDATAVLEVVDRINAAPDLTAYARITCESILGMLPALSVSYNELNPITGRTYGVIAPDPGPGWFRTYRPVFEAYLNDNPLIGHYLATGDTRVVAWGDPEVGTVAGSTLDREFYQPNGIRSQAAMVLPAPPGIVIGIAVNRGPEGFSQVDRRLLSLLRPHLVHAYRAVQVRSDASLLGRVLGEHGWAVVLVDGEGRVVRSSPGTIESAARYGLDVAEGARLAAGPLDRIRALIQDYDPATPAAASPPIPVVGPAGALAAVVVPSTVGPHVVLLRGRSDLAALRAAGLTTRQAEVALGLAAGESGPEIAKRLGISPATARKHLEAIFSRLGVNHRAAAVARITAIR
jgi:DNA-binding CsgD family transcriptional regulator